MQIVKSRAVPKGSTSEMEDLDRVEGSKGAAIIELFGEWQTVEWQPPRAVGGIVPRVSCQCCTVGTIQILIRMGSVITFIHPWQGFYVQMYRKSLYKTSVNFEMNKVSKALCIYLSTT